MDQISESKIFEPAALAQHLRGLQAQGQVIVFTNGCFDLVHKGHTRYLREARAQGDALVVALNTDASVSRLKGERRPVVPLEERAEILAGFYFIDFVTYFDEDTPFELISLLRPDRLIKGGDYALDQIVGRELVESWGGKVSTIPEIPGGSTTGTIDRILKAYGPHV
ncbi:MAG: D-glycero-beta-D-manno-heptose 1-phosphate adenylyltransferase [bacterium]|nr:D-glycero-beta-D-manno-heptose 1-phosphate adenylyltransferase [bacterium]